MGSQDLHTEIVDGEIVKIYLGFTGNKTVATFMRKYDCGWLFTPNNYSKNFRESFIIDNGVYSAWKNNIAWDEKRFYEFLREFIPYKPDFTVIPDIVAGGYDSLKFSLKHIDGIPHPRYLAVQDGMQSDPIRKIINKIDGIFVGGTVKWKMRTVGMWADTAHLHGIKCHVGRIGTFQGYALCDAWGVDSVDGTNPSRNCDERPLRMFKEQKTFNSFEWMDVEENSEFPRFCTRDLSKQCNGCGICW